MLGRRRSGSTGLQLAAVRARDGLSLMWSNSRSELGGFTRSKVWKRAFVGLLIALGLSACTDSPDEVDGSGNIRAVHAISDLSQVAFLIEGVVVAQASFQSITPYSNYDSLQYDFNFDFNSGLTNQVERLATTSVTLVPDTNYTFVLTGTGAAPELITITQPLRTFDTGTTVLEGFFGNLARNAGSVDIYFGAVGFDPAASTPVVSGLALNGFSPTQDIEAGEYEFVATVAGEPANVLIRTDAITLLAADSIMINLMDAANETNGDYVFVVGGGINNGRLVDQSAQSTLRLINGARNAGAVDVFVNDEAVTPAIANVEFAQISAATPIPEAADAVAFSLNVTAAGNVGAPLFDVETAFTNASLNLLVLSPSVSDTSFGLLRASGSRRPLFDAGRIGVLTTIESVDLVNLYLIESGTTFEDANPRATNIGVLQDISQFTLVADTYQLYVTNSTDNAIIIGPIDIPVGIGDIIQLVLTDAVDPTSLDVLTYDLTTP